MIKAITRAAVNAINAVRIHEPSTFKTPATRYTALSLPQALSPKDVPMATINVTYVVDNGNLHAHFHSHMADKSNQDAASTHAHMRVLLELLISQKKISPGKSTIWEHTDGCTKQYRCAKALYLLSSLASEFKVVIDRQVDAPGHGKDVVDGLNAQDKVYLRKHMIS